jgi:hypothetical protein
VWTKAAVAAPTPARPTLPRCAALTHTHAQTRHEPVSGPSVAEVERNNRDLVDTNDHQTLTAEEIAAMRTSAKVGGGLYHPRLSGYSPARQPTHPRHTHTTATPCNTKHPTGRRCHRGGALQGQRHVWQQDRVCAGKVQEAQGKKVCHAPHAAAANRLERVRGVFSVESAGGRARGWAEWGQQQQRAELQTRAGQLPPLACSFLTTNVCCAALCSCLAPQGDV